MNGLEAILNRIISDTEDKILDINEQTNTRCAELLAKADQDAAKIICDAEQQAKEQTAILLRRSESLSALETRKQVLSARQTLIDEVIEQAAVRLASLPDEDKSALYKRLLLTYAQGSEAVIFSKQDAALAARILADVNAAKNWQLTAAPESGSFSGGLILRQDLIETNLTVELLIRSLRPELVGLTAQALFGA